MLKNVETSNLTLLCHVCNQFVLSFSVLTIIKYMILHFITMSNAVVQNQTIEKNTCRFS